MPRLPTDEELRALRAFQRQVDRLRRSTIAQQGKVTFTYTTKFKLSTGELDDAFKGYDEVAFQAQLPLLRQFLLESDPIRFCRIHDIVMQCCGREDLREWTKYARQRWVQTLHRLPIDDHRFFHDAKDTVEKAIAKLFYGYGGLFHVNLDEPDEEAVMRDIQQAMLQHAFPFFCNCLNNLDSVIHIWLDDQSRTVPALPQQ